MNADYHTDQESATLYQMFDTAAAVLIDEIQRDLTRAQKKEAECYSRADGDGARVWGIKIEKLERELKAAKGDGA